MKNPCIDIVDKILENNRKMWFSLPENSNIGTDYINLTLPECRTALVNLIKAVDTRRERQRAGCGFSFMEIDYDASVRAETNALETARKLLTKD